MPRCTGSNADGARRARSDGLRHYRAATRGTTFNAAEMSAALRSFDQACTDGDDSALEFRAYALAGLGRYVEAAETLDEFARLHPLDAGPADVRDRVNSQRGQILAQVATLDVTSTVPGAMISVNGRTVGAAPANDIRVAPGRASIEVSATGYRTARRDVDLTAGSTRVEAVTLESEGGRRRGGGGSSSSSGAQSDEGGGGGLSPLVIAAGVAGVVGVGVGVGAQIWRSNRADVYNNACVPTPVENCDAVQREFNTATAVAITGYIAGGVLLAGAITGAVIHFVSGGGDDRGHAVRAACGPDVINRGVQCVVAF